MSTSQTAGATGANGVKRVPPLQVILSLATLACWIMLYAAGFLMESIEERIVLAPHMMEKQASTMKYFDIDKHKKLRNAAKSTADQKTNAAVKPSAYAQTATDHKPSSEAKVATDPKTPAITNSADAEAAQKGDKVIEKLLAEERSIPKTFFVAMLIHTPTNMALLTLFAGCLGGCVSNIKYSMMTQEERNNLTTQESSILCENPLSATLRGFVIYLCLIAGLYAAVDDPFKDSTPGQYARLAGSLSLVAFIVGFDPSRIKAWLKMADQKETKTTP